MNIERLVKGYYMVICCVHYTRPSWSSDGFNSARKPSVAECAELAGWVGWPDGRVGSPWKPTLSPPRCRNHPWKNRKIPCSTGNMLKTPPHVPHGVVLIFFCFNGYASFGQKVSVNQMGEEEDLQWGWLWALRSPLHLACEQSSVELTRWGATWNLLIFVCLRPSFPLANIGVAWCDNKWIS